MLIFHSYVNLPEDIKCANQLIVRGRQIACGYGSIFCTPGTRRIIPLAKWYATTVQSHLMTYMSGISHYLVG